MINREYAKMCVDNGWHSLVDEAFDLIEKEEGVTVVQVKEKFGELRIYTEESSESLRQAIHEIEYKSCSICESCGMPASPKKLGWWIKTICESCERI